MLFCKHTVSNCLFNPHINQFSSQPNPGFYRVPSPVLQLKISGLKEVSLLSLKFCLKHLYFFCWMGCAYFLWFHRQLSVWDNTQCSWAGM